MKKLIALLLVFALALPMAACDAKQTEVAPTTTAPVVETAPTETETVVTEPTTPEEVPEIAPEETPETTPEELPQETTPQETPEQTPTATDPAPTVTPAKPSGNANTKPSGGTTVKPSGGNSKPSGGTTASGKPTSYSTCKDTGSNEVWYNPKAATFVDYYQESDPERKDYLEYLKRNGNEFYYWLQEDSGMRMYVGRTYGMPLYTSYELMIATTWRSSDPTVATVNEYGFVTPLKAGYTVISATYVSPESGYENVRTTPVRVESEIGKTYAELEALAKEEAKQIANYILTELQCETDLEKVAAAAAIINLNYVEKNNGGTYYAIVDGNLVNAYVPGYNQPFGTLVTNYSTCAGDVRALGMVLEYLGFQWYHVNENQNAHQWLVVYDVDGQTAFADGSMYGIAGYGERKEDMSNWQIFRYNALQPFQ